MPLALLLPIGACTMPSGVAEREAPAAEALTPIAGSATAAGSGGEPVRVQRSYHAASGRACREVVLGFGAGERATLQCQDATGNWIASRPLLRGGGNLPAGIARP